MHMKVSFTNIFTGGILVFAIIVGSSCANTKNATYFPGVKDGKIQSTTAFPESVIQKNDILSITVSSLNPEASMIFNQPVEAGGPNGDGTSFASASGYLVSLDGNIQFPLLGSIKAEGLTKNQLKDKLVKSFLDKKLLLDPIVTIRFTNFRITVLGEVNHPTVVNVPNEKISLLEAIGLAGDLTMYAERKNVMIIREEKDQKIIKRINLNSGELFTSPFYYLQSNDIVYVEPNKAKVASVSRGMQWVPVIMSGLTLAVLVVDRINN
jgi:polysaccharide export outer membrane protein